MSSRNVLVPAIVATVKSMHCMDESGAAVDWWFLSKHPGGASYSFVTSQEFSWTSGSRDVTNTGSLMGQQMAGIYAGTDPNYVFYNDQKPDGSTSSSHGHSKGFFSYNDDSAFWVQHSIPDFPNYVADGYQYGSSQERYGQHAFCMTLSLSNLNDIAGVMKYSNGMIFDHQIDGSLSNVTDIVEGAKEKSGSVAVNVDTAWGKLRLFGKTVDFNNDILEAVVAPDLGISFLYQSWLNTGGKLGSFCNGETDVLDATVIVELPATATHKSSSDHSKWAVARDSSSLWFCGADNNHVESQYRRSGLAVCLQHKELSSAMRDTIGTANSCDPSPPTPTPSPSPPQPTPIPSPSPVGDCGGVGVSWNACKESGCTYVYSANTDACGVEGWGCYAAGSLPGDCPESSLSMVV